MNKNILPFSKVVVNIFDSIKIKNTKNTINIYDEWGKILEELATNSVNSSDNSSKNSDSLSYHSRLVDLKKGVLFIEVDHPGWIEILNVKKNTF